MFTSTNNLPTELATYSRTVLLSAERPTFSSSDILMKIIKRRIIFFLYCYFHTSFMNKSVAK